MNECAKKCCRTKSCCEQKQCRLWIDYKKDLNCTLISVNTHGNMTLDEVSKRLGVSIVRIKQIQDVAVLKLKKKRHLKL